MKWFKMKAKTGWQHWDYDNVIVYIRVKNSKIYEFKRINIEFKDCIGNCERLN